MAGPKLLSADWDKPESWTLATYRAGGGYQALPKAPEDAAAADRGRSGEVQPARARRRGLPTGMKWNFVRKRPASPSISVLNATRASRAPQGPRDPLRSPHMLVEG